MYFSFSMEVYVLNLRLGKEYESCIIKFRYEGGWKGERKYIVGVR